MPARAMTCHNVYLKGNGGYDAAVLIIRVDEGRNVFPLIRMVPWETGCRRSGGEDG